MAKRAQSFATDSHGNIAVEFALVAPIFMLLIAGLVDYGLASRERSTMDAAARAGLQLLILDVNDTAGAETSAATVAPATVVDASIACICVDGLTVDCDAGTCASGVPRHIATVSVTKSHALLFPWPGFDDPLALSAIATVRVQ